MGTSWQAPVSSQLSSVTCTHKRAGAQCTESGSSQGSAQHHVQGRASAPALLLQFLHLTHAEQTGMRRAPCYRQMQSISPTPTHLPHLLPVLHPGLAVGKAMQVGQLTHPAAAPNDMAQPAATKWQLLPSTNTPTLAQQAAKGMPSQLVLGAQLVPDHPHRTSQHLAAQSPAVARTRPW